MSSFSFAQSSVGFIDNYVGIQGLKFNPAHILDTFHQVDINLFSVSGTAGNNYASLNPYRIVNDFDFGINNIQKISSRAQNQALLYNDLGIKSKETYLLSKTTRNNSRFYGNATLLGPSFLWNINKYNAFAFTTAVKVYANAYDLNTSLYDDIVDQTQETGIQDLTDGFLAVPTNFSQAFSWAEVGFSYAGLVKQSNSDLLKIGFGLKFLRGLKSAAIFSDDLSVKLNYNEADSFNSTLDFRGNVYSLNSLASANFGMGLDIGFVYEKRGLTMPYYTRDKKNSVYFAKAPYLYKVSVAITNIGFLNFDRVQQNVYTLKDELPVNTFNPATFFSVRNLKTTQKTFLLPTTAHLNFDYHFLDKWFVNANLDLHTFPTAKREQIKTVSNFTISPRYERLKLSVFFPSSINKFGVFKSGIGFRTGFLTVGSASLFTNVSSYSKEGDFFVALKIPVYNRKAIRQQTKSLRYKYLTD